MKRIYTVIFFLLFLTLDHTAFSQETPDAANIDSLYAQRLTLDAGGQDYANIERTILSTGIYPRALVNTSSSEEGRSFEFRTYKTIAPERQDQIEQRLIVSVSGITSVEINNQHVSVTFSQSTPEENVLAFFKLLGYKNYEIRN